MKKFDARGNKDNIGGYMIKNGNSRILKLSMQMKRRDWFKGLWSSTELMSWPFLVPS
jgi:hypothetical protein